MLQRFGLTNPRENDENDQKLLQLASVDQSPYTIDVNGVDLEGDYNPIYDPYPDKHVPTLGVVHQQTKISFEPRRV